MGPHLKHFSEEVIPKARVRFQSKAMRGRMLRGADQARAAVRDSIPWGAVPKGADPHWRNTYDYSIALLESHSLTS